MIETGIRIPRIHARPSMISGSKVIRSNLISPSPGSYPNLLHQPVTQLQPGRLHGTPCALATQSRQPAASPTDRRRDSTDHRKSCAISHLEIASERDRLPPPPPVLTCKRHPTVLVLDPPDSCRLDLETAPI